MASVPERKRGIRYYLSLVLLIIAVVCVLILTFGSGAAWMSPAIAFWVAVIGVAAFVLSIIIDPSVLSDVGSAIGGVFGTVIGSAIGALASSSGVSSVLLYCGVGLLAYYLFRKGDNQDVEDQFITNNGRGQPV